MRPLCGDALQVEYVASNSVTCYESCKNHPNIIVSAQQRGSNLELATFLYYPRHTALGPALCLQSVQPTYRGNYCFYSHEINSVVQSVGLFAPLYEGFGHFAGFSDSMRALSQQT